MKIPLALFASMLFHLGCANAQESPKELAGTARAILEAACHRCHGNNGSVEGGLSYILDRQQLVARKRIIPGDSAKSKLLQRIESDEMPPDGEKPRPSKDDLALLKKWIDAGALDFNPPAAARNHMNVEDLFKHMNDDLVKQDAADRRSFRYFTLSHLYNAGRSNDEIQSYRSGISKLINSLSWGRKVVAPKPIDPDQTILRIDLRDYKWTAKTWDAISGADPYGLVYPSSRAAKALYADTGCGLPHVRGDWFVASASRPPLYHEVLQLPVTEKELETLLRVDAEDNIRTNQVVRAGFNGSAVSRNNRLIERHESSYGYYWKSYDFAKNVGRQNLFAYPLGPGTSEKLFKHDGGELIFSLPNGFQAYMLVNGEGKRIEKGPTEIVSDPRRPDRAVENGLSCMTCHVRGLLPKDDQIRAHVESNPTAFTKKEIEAILALYPTKDRFGDLVKEDSDKYRKATAQAGIELGTNEPIAALASVFESELDLNLAAGEMYLKPNDFQKFLKQSATLSRELGNLQNSGGSVQRDVFVRAFPEMVRVWRLGTLAAKNPSGAIGTSAAMINLGGKNQYPAVLQPSKQILADKDGLHLTGGRFYLMTKKGDYLARDFRFEVVYSLKNGNGNDIVFIGIGEADRSAAYNEPKSSIYLGIQPPNLENGRIALNNKTGGGSLTLGKISKEGTHRAIIEKKGDTVTFTIDVDNDGPSDDDIEKVIPDIKEFGPFLNKKNSYLFFGGGGTFKQFRISE